MLEVWTKMGTQYFIGVAEQIGVTVTWDSQERTSSSTEQHSRAILPCAAVDSELGSKAVATKTPTTALTQDSQTLSHATCHMMRMTESVPVMVSYA